jgi:hypothetical protein
MSRERSGAGNLNPMSALPVRVRAALLLLAGALALVVAAAIGPNPGALLTALAASAAVAVVATVALREFVLAPAEASLQVGARAREHRESLDRIAAPTHPDTAGRVRSRAPGGATSVA